MSAFALRRVTARAANLIVFALIFFGFVLSACSSGGSSEQSRTTTPKPDAKPQLLRILVTNDDGFDAPGIDVVTEALRKLPRVEVTVVAPATNKSGTGSQSTPGTLTATEQRTVSGYPSTAVDGFPADTVRYALDTQGLRPDVVVSGINAGQNLGPITDVSGTVGAAKAAAARGIPAIAASQGLVTGVDAQYRVGAELVVAWIRAHRSTSRSEGHSFLGRNGADVVNLNIPTCAAGQLRGVKTVPLATDDAGALDPADCVSTTTDVTTDIAAFHSGFAAVTELTPTGQTVTSSTTFPTKPSG